MRYWIPGTSTTKKRSGLCAGSFFVWLMCNGNREEQHRCDGSRHRGENYCTFTNKCRWCLERSSRTPPDKTDLQLEAKEHLLPQPKEKGDSSATRNRAGRFGT